MGSFLSADQNLRLIQLLTEKYENWGAGAAQRYLDRLASHIIREQQIIPSFEDLKKCIEEEVRWVRR